ncbi:MAG: hypothetical protein FWJ65_12500 [Limnochordales bacterium]
MAIRIEEKKAEIPVEIGELKFSFKVTDDAVLDFRKNSLAVMEELKGLQIKPDEEDETIMEKVKEVLQKGFDTILGEGAFEKIYDMTPSVFLLMRYFEQLAAGLAEELKNMGALEVLNQRAENYLRKK